MTDAQRDQLDLRVLVLAPTGKDAALTQEMLQRAGIACAACSTADQLTAELQLGAGVVLLAEEAVGESRQDRLADWIACQPSWSDLPILVLARSGADSAAVARAMDLLGNVAVLERPTRVAALVSAVRTALRARQRQYQIRDHLVDRDWADEGLRQMNSRLIQTLLEIGETYAQSPVGMLQLDTDLRYVRINRTLAAMNGIPAADHIGKTIHEVVPELAPQLEAAFRNVMQTGQPVTDIELVGETAADPGVPHTWLESWYPLRDERGQVIGLNIVAQDITDRKRAEQALREREQFVSGILGSITDAFMCLDKEWRFTLVNDETLARFQLSRAEVLGKNIWELFPAAAGNEAHTQLHRAMAERTSAEYEVFYEPWNQWFFDKAYPLADGGIAILSRDITERKESDEQIRRSAELLTFLIDRSPSGFYIVDADFRISHINADSQARAFRNVMPAIGRRLDEAMRILWPEPLATELIGIFRHTLDTGEPYRSPGLVSPRNDLDVVETYEWQLDRITLPDGTYGVVCYYYDTTLLREAERDLRESEQRFRELANNIDQFAWTCDELGKATWYNRRWYEYTGTTFESMQGEGWKAVHDPAHLERVVAGLQASIVAGEPWEDTFPLRGEDGTFRWFLSRAIPIHDDTGRVVRWFGTNTDITEQRQLEVALRDADRRKDEFLAILAHELRNPLAPIRNSLHILRMSAQHDAAADRVGEMMERQVNHMVRLVDDLLEVSRITRGKIELRKEPIEVAAIVRSAVETSRPLIEAAGHQLALAIPAEPLTLEGDPVRLAQVLANLLNNAAKYTKPGGQIWLSVRREGEGAAISVRDNGTGIPPEMLPQIFDMFTQVEGNVERAQGGLGIGLTLVKSLIQLHGGSVTAHSDGAGCGSEFVIRLPLVVEARPALLPNAFDKPSSGLGARRILVADDNRDAAKSLGMLLKLLGAQVQIVYCGAEALAALPSFRPDVVLLDIGMPGMDGHEVARRIRQNPEYQQVTLIALTGWGQAEDRRRTAESGFDHHLTKPADVGVLESLLGTLENDSASRAAASRN